MSLKKNKKKHYRKFSLFLGALVLGVFLSVVLLALAPSISLAPSSAAPASANDPLSAAPGFVGTPQADVFPPSVPANFSGYAYLSNSVILSWNPSTDDVSDSRSLIYIIYRNGAQLAFKNKSSFLFYFDYPVTPGTTYSYSILAVDEIGRESPKSGTISVTVPLIDTTPPTVSIISPSNGASVSDIIDITANALDDRAMEGGWVLFYVDGVNVGYDFQPSNGNILGGDYMLSWNSTGRITNGMHTLSVVAYDNYRNPSTQSSISVSIDNVESPVCGDGICQLGETATSCSADCSPPPSGGGGGGTPPPSGDFPPGDELYKEALI
jgi:hypothetical protein